MPDDDEALDDIALRWTEFGDWRGEVRKMVAVTGRLVACEQRVEICRHATVARVFGLKESSARVANRASGCELAKKRRRLAARSC